MKHRILLAKQIHDNYSRPFPWRSTSFVFNNSPLVALSFSLFLILAYCLPTYAQTAYNFIPVTPCRVADTRNAQGPFGGPAIAAQSTRSFAIPSSACNIPATAAAYALNVTVVPQGTLGYLTVWPTGQSQPLVSTLNSYDGRVKANAAIIPVGSAGAISIFATDTTDVVLDISGYFVSTTNSSALFFFPVTPCRIADTRNPTGSLGGPSMMAGVARNFPVQSSGCGISGLASAYSLNFTVVPKSPLGYLTVWPSDQVQPVVSTLNAPTGAVTANAAIVPAAANGSISAFVTDDSDLIIDVNGYFGPASAGSNPLSLLTVAPCRVLDTRNTTILNGTLNVNVAGSPCGIPSAASAHIMNATVVPSSSLGFLTLWPHGLNRPLVSTLNAIDGYVTSNMAIIPASNGWIDAYSTDQTQLILDITGYFADIATLQILTSTLPGGTQNTFYSVTLGAQGGLTPYSWTLASGTLPPGLTLNTAGVLSGTPTSSGTSTFTVKVTDAEAPAVYVTKQLTLTIASGWAGTISCHKYILPGAPYGYHHDEIQTWHVGGTPSQLTGQTLIPYSWTANGSGGESGPPGQSWTVNVTGAGQIAETTDSQGNPNFQRFSSQIAVHNGMMGTPTSYTEYEYQFLPFAGSKNTMPVQGSQSYPGPNCDLPVMPGGAICHVDCSWNLSQH